MREDHELYSKVFNFIHDAKVPLQGKYTDVYHIIPNVFTAPI